MRLQLEPDAAGFKGLLQQGAGGGVELSVQQPLANVQHGDLHPALGEAVGSFKPEQAATDNHGVVAGLSGIHHSLGVGNVAVADHTVQSVAGYREDKGAGAGGQQQAVVLGAASIGGDDAACSAIDAHYRVAQMQGDPVTAVPVQIVEHDVVKDLFAGQYRRQHDAVVVGMRFCAEYRDVVEIGCQLEQLFQRADAGHAVANQYQFQFVHHPCAPCCAAKTKKASRPFARWGRLCPFLFLQETGYLTRWPAM